MTYLIKKKKSYKLKSKVSTMYSWYIGNEISQVFCRNESLLHCARPLETRKQAQSKITMAILSPLGFNRNTPRDALFAEQTIGGAGLQHLFLVVQGTRQVRATLFRTIPEPTTTKERRMDPNTTPISLPFQPKTRNITNHPPNTQTNRRPFHPAKTQTNQRPFHPPKTQKNRRPFHYGYGH